VNQSVDVDIKLEVGTLNEQVEVVATAPLLQTSDSQVGGLIENKQIQDLPLAARDFMQLTLLAPAWWSRPAIRGTRRNEAVGWDRSPCTA